MSTLFTVLPQTKLHAQLASTITRINTDSSGTQANGPSTDSITISADNRYVAFYSLADNLVAGDTNFDSDIFVKDTQTGTTTMVSTDSSGTQGNFGSIRPRISANGRYVAFASFADNLVSGDVGGHMDIFVKDLQTGTTTRVSTDSSGNESNGSNEYPQISSDGHYVTFYSSGTNLVGSDTNAKWDIFRKDTITGTTIRVSTDSSATQSNGDSFFPSMSTNGRYISFESDSTNLVGSDTNATIDVFVKDTTTGTTTRVSTNSSGTEANDYSEHASISNDGRYVSFDSQATNLVASDTNATIDVFVKDTTTGTTTRVSTNSSGTEANDASSHQAAIASFSNDDRYIVFDSAATNLTSGDTNATTDIFLKDMITGTTTLISTDSSGVEGNAYSESGGISSDGQFAVFWSSSTNLVSGDTNATDDVFLKSLTTPPTGSGRSLEVSSGAVSANNVSYTFKFTLVSSSAVQSIRLRYCTTPGTSTCTQPAGINTSGYTVSSQAFTQATSFTAQTSNSNQCTVGTGTNNQFETCLHRTDSTAETAAQKQITLAGITNPSVAGTVYVRITLYNTDNFTSGGIIYDELSVATAINPLLTVSARVQEVLHFCVANTSINDATSNIGSDCTAITGTTGSSVDLGLVDTSTTGTASPDPDGNNLNAMFMVRSNAIGGTVVGYRAVQQSGTNYRGALRIVGSTCAGSANTVGSSGSSTDTCFNSNTTKTVMTTALEEFGITGRYINRSSSTVPTSNLSLTTDYDSTSTLGYAWQQDGTYTPVATSAPSTDKVIDDEAVIIKLGAVAALTTPPGQYTAQADFIAIPTY